ncbi:hypothetical protein DB35_26650 [Streptomyces abyssalis]|uniref:Uncharacterized protein n=1 Tax=Streptomyces abyssalis TaxID=933944 RepID=A0A1E7JMA8_9ACTN|nr:hypothetical protein [Streptomyces abyssalis]OEU87106.1 hypothetical protein DB35_26650 [Streptomyces abyssalis]OEU89005.1 hypothetical protein AN215_14690 [Streptomyces abyssalis]OEV06606.1 hypothetical protein AN219_34075 [Streptomyces nanshensis]
MSDCPYCGWPDDEPVRNLSEHPTGDGVLFWTRCACGSVQARVLTGGTVRIVTRGKPAGPRTAAPRTGTRVDC